MSLDTLKAGEDWNGQEFNEEPVSSVIMADKPDAFDCFPKILDVLLESESVDIMVDSLSPKLFDNNKCSKDDFSDNRFIQTNLTKKKSPLISIEGFAVKMDSIPLAGIDENYVESEKYESSKTITNPHRKKHSDKKEENNIPNLSKNSDKNETNQLSKNVETTKNVSVNSLNKTNNDSNKNIISDTKNDNQKQINSNI